VRESPISDQEQVPTVAIVGLGPRGLYCLEALAEEFRAHPLATGLRVVVFNRTGSFGVSPVYDVDQPIYLLSNSSAGELDLWPHEPECRSDNLNFLSWYSQRFEPSVPINEDFYPARSLIGHYLKYGYDAVVSRLPHGMTVYAITAEVIDLERCATGEYRLEFISSNSSHDEMIVDKILLTTGHSTAKLTTQEHRYRDFAARHRTTVFIPRVRTIEEQVRQVSSKANVAIKGIGLTFIDVVLALTEGRGGCFERTSDGELYYLASGDEPNSIMPFSRSGLPMVPKPRDLPVGLRALTFVTQAKIEELRAGSARGKVDFKKDIWPLVELEMERQYYLVAMADTEGDSLRECGDDPVAMRKVIDAFLRTSTDAPFALCNILDPIAERCFVNGIEFHSFVVDYLNAEVDFARRGLNSSPARAAISIWFEVRDALKPLVAHGGLTPESHKLLIESYFPAYKRVVFGPPVVNSEKILALCKYGLLNFSIALNPSIVTCEVAGAFLLRSALANSDSIADVLIDARSQPVSVVYDMAPLYRNLFASGAIREFVNVPEDSEGVSYRTGAIDVSPGLHHAISSHGAINSSIAIAGIPTEGNLIGTFSISRDGFDRVWAADVIEQFRQTSTNR
jgi:hypothetical protein